MPIVAFESMQLAQFREDLMTSTARLTLGLLIVAPAIAAFSCAGERKSSERTSSGRPSAEVRPSGGPAACALIDTTALKRLTGRTDPLEGPPRVYTGELDPGVSRCEWLGYVVELTFPAKREDLQEMRAFHKDMSTKEQAVSGVGEEAYLWWTTGPKSALHSVGIVVREKSSLLNIMDVATSDSIEIKKPGALAVAKLLAPNLK